ncbi:hypothetical protein O181_037990 [Austropuccinia psidii MF-1]|uniref:Uncharacterized protein n=1 Tax=Austropuccinia psidii MF-1 TaxID=1389203 RepID=A0A9Q3DC24_9BASI|nr:hypothetical protein [Austropuccinia psidii MF-1]
MKAKKGTPIATQRSRRELKSASIQGKPTLIAFTGKITIINPVVTSKGKLPKAVDDKFVQGTVKVVDGKTLRETIPTLPFTFQLNRNLKPEDWKDMDQALKLQQLLKDLSQWSMDTKRFNLASHWAELGASFKKICLNKIALRTAEPDRAYSNSFRFPRVDQTNSQVASHHSGMGRLVAKSHHSSKSHVISRRRQEYKGKNNTSFRQSQRESEPMIQKLLDLVKKVHKRWK